MYVQHDPCNWAKKINDKANEGETAFVIAWDVNF